MYIGPDMLTTLDFVRMHYAGRIRDWEEFSATEYLPAFFSGMAIACVSNEYLSCMTKSVSFSCSNNVLPVSPWSAIDIKVNYSKGSGEWRLGISSFFLLDRKFKAGVFRYGAPEENAADEYRAFWGKMNGRQSPYDKVTVLYGRSSSVEGLLAKVNDKAVVTNGTQYLFQCTIAAETNAPPATRSEAELKGKRVAACFSVLD